MLTSRNKFNFQRKHDKGPSSKSPVGIPRHSPAPATNLPYHKLRCPVQLVVPPRGASLIGLQALCSCSSQHRGSFCSISHQLPSRWQLPFLLQIKISRCVSFGPSHAPVVQVLSTVFLGGLRSRQHIAQDKRMASLIISPKTPCACLEQCAAIE